MIVHTQHLHVILWIHLNYSLQKGPVLCIDKDIILHVHTKCMKKLSYILCGIYIPAFNIIIIVNIGILLNNSLIYVLSQITFEWLVNSRSVQLDSHYDTYLGRLLLIYLELVDVKLPSWYLNNEMIKQQDSGMQDH